MTTKSTVFALLGATFFFAASAVTATLAVDRDRTPIRSAADPASCPPEACSIVVKTAVGAGPSPIFTPAVQSTAKSDRLSTILLADAGE